MSASGTARRCAVPLKPLYTADDIDGVAHLGGLPGVAPWPRAAHTARNRMGNRNALRKYLGAIPYRLQLAGGWIDQPVAPAKK